jgi:hypothetical protein
MNSLYTQHVTLKPEFIFGCNGEIPNSLKLLPDERSLMYVAGHNVVFYNMEEKQQTFVPGTEGSLGINYITVSKDT